MKIYNSRLDAVLSIIKISQLNAKEFEEVTGLTRSRLYSWRSGKVKISIQAQRKRLQGN
tara:strand:- start:16 stop:192 length:177 start_codon:yes stop_codon:yes gene_type:complete